MGSCFYRIKKCGECCCYSCCMIGVFYHMHEEGNLTCEMVKSCCKTTTEIIIEDIKRS